MSNQELNSKNLNPSQKEAVETIDGPLMVIAGPGTGKTQLLSARTANIVKTTDINPGNILCLTYTETGATEMRNRLMQIMGTAGGDVAVHTFHSFGTWIISQYPNYFIDQKALRPLDDISKYQVLESLLAGLPFRHKLAVRDENENFVWLSSLGDLIRAIKQSGLSVQQLKDINASNKKSAPKLNEMVQDLFSSTLSIKNINELQHVVDDYQSKIADDSLSKTLIAEINEAIEECIKIGKTGPLGDWRTKHVTTLDGQKVLKTFTNLELLDDSLGLYEQYQQILEKKGRYDYEDMVNWATDVLNAEQDVLLDLAEQFQYIMVDEYQDTNGSQNALLDALLLANPLNSPNIMVVGDDDQAIMRFQGAEYSGMMNFTKKYNPKIIILTDNYRSSQPILDLSREVMTSTPDRLEVLLSDIGLDKKLTAKNDQRNCQIEHRSYQSLTTQYSEIADDIAKLIKAGVPANQIAVIGKKHAPLGDFAQHLDQRKISFSYDRRQSILENSKIERLIELAKYICLLSEDKDAANHLLPTILAANYWELGPLDSYKIASAAREQKVSWLDVMLGSEKKEWQDIAEILITLAKLSKVTNFTNMLDLLVGRQDIPDTAMQKSPYKKYLDSEDPDGYFSLLSHLIILRTKVLEAKPGANKLYDMIDVVQQYKTSDIDIHDNNPLLSGNLNGVQLMTAHGSKGREFDYVIILSAIDEMWGKKARSRTQKIPLPENLILYPAGDSDSDRIRLLYVAMTRAKNHLIFTSYQLNDNGKPTNSLALIDQEPNAVLEPKINDKNIDLQTGILDTAWNAVTPQNKRNLQTILQPHINTYKLSASAIQSFVDVRYGGPMVFVEKSLLKFPSAYNIYTALGSASHSTIEYAYRAFSMDQPLSEAKIIKHLDNELDMSGLTKIELASARQHAHSFIPRFIKYFTSNDFNKIIYTEKYLNAVITQNAVSITGSIDAIAEHNSKLNIIDYKTGKPPQDGWNTKSLSESKKIGLHFNKQQLYFYKILMDECSAISKPVESAELIFVESADENYDEIIRLKITDFDKEYMERLKKLIEAISKKINNSDFPDISTYSKNLKGITAFEDDLIDTI
jgi:DNA helicase-2/ATP-dependent DNA helicase PcrA